MLVKYASQVRESPPVFAFFCNHPEGVKESYRRYLENQLREAGHRVLIVETSTDPDFELTREFYLKCGYVQEAVIRDFWKEGEGKVIFWKKL